MTTAKTFDPEMAMAASRYATERYTPDQFRHWREDIQQEILLRVWRAWQNGYCASADFYRWKAIDSMRDLGGRIYPQDKCRVPRHERGRRYDEGYLASTELMDRDVLAERDLLEVLPDLSEEQLDVLVGCLTDERPEHLKHLSHSWAWRRKKRVLQHIRSALAAKRNRRRFRVINGGASPQKDL